MSTPTINPSHVEITRQVMQGLKVIFLGTAAIKAVTIVTLALIDRSSK